MGDCDSLNSLTITYFIHFNLSLKLQTIHFSIEADNLPKHSYRSTNNLVVYRVQFCKKSVKSS